MNRFKVRKSVENSPMWEVVMVAKYKSIPVWLTKSWVEAMRTADYWTQVHWSSASESERQVYRFVHCRKLTLPFCTTSCERKQ